MDNTIDANLAEIRRISERIANTEPGPDRAALESRRDALRRAARSLADTTKSVQQLEAELANVESRLAAMGEVEIKPAWVEGHKLINDPSAYRRRINESIQRNEAPEREQLEQRRQELREALRAATQPE